MSDLQPVPSAEGDDPVLPDIAGLTGVRGVPWELLRRALDTSPDRAGDRLAALGQLRWWIEESESQAVVGARLAGLSWADIGEAAGGLSRRAALHRWGEVIARLEHEGLLPPPPDPGPPADPVVPAWASTPGIVWCRWCGQRLGMPGGVGGWVHCLSGPDQISLVESPDLADECPGPEPWPAREPWPDG